LRRLEKNPLRVLDCKTDSNKLVKVPKMSNYLCHCCNDNFNLTQSLLKSVGCNYTVDQRLVRGLDYYTKVVFEIRSGSVGSQDALAAGGRYDNLVGELGGQDISAVGFALGSERVLFAAQKTEFFSSFEESEKIFVAVADQELFSKAFSFAIKMTRNGLKSNKNISVFGPINGKSLTSQLKFADKIKATKTIVFARTEFEDGKLLVKNMKDKTQTKVPISEFSEL
jgi:histidyl-tRNA synthetase